MPLWLVMSRHNGSMSMTFSFSLSLTHTHAHSSVKASHIPTSVEALWRNWMELPRLLSGSEEYKNTLCTPLAASFSTRFLHKSCAFFFLSLPFLTWYQVFLDARIGRARVFTRRDITSAAFVVFSPTKQGVFFFSRWGTTSWAFYEFKKTKTKEECVQGFSFGRN